MCLAVLCLDAGLELLPGPKKPTLSESGFLIMIFRKQVPKKAGDMLLR